MRYLLLVLALFSSIATAEPLSAEFGQLEVYVPHAGKSGLTVKQFADAMKGDKLWVQSDGNWILKVSISDPMTNTTDSIVFMFTKREKLADVTRFVAGGQEVAQILFPNFVWPMVERARKTQKK
jgi:hypothetical protein